MSNDKIDEKFYANLLNATKNNAVNWYRVDEEKKKFLLNIDGRSVGIYIDAISNGACCNIYMMTVEGSGAFGQFEMPDGNLYVAADGQILKREYELKKEQEEQNRLKREAMFNKSKAIIEKVNILLAP